MIKWRCAVFQAVWYLLPVLAGAEQYKSIELSAGTVYNVPTPLVVRQSGHDDIDVTARYDTQPFERPAYYSFRLSRWDNDTGWALELTHHKLYLTNRPAGIQDFSISHGYNIITVNRGWKFNEYVFHLGSGIVLAHPESTVRGKKHSEERGLMGMGYYLSGPAFQATAGRQFWPGGMFFLVIEGKVTAAYSSVPVADGDASVPNVAAHGVLGIGFQF